MPDTGYVGVVGSSAHGAGVGTGSATKRCLDLMIAVPLVVLLAPLLVGIAIAIRLDSPGPSLFTQERIGSRRRIRDGREEWVIRPFRIVKFRTMVHDADPEVHVRFIEACAVRPEELATAGPDPFKLVADPRVTRVGTFLRRTSLDELPQLFNVIRGEMSLVGPRPVPPYEVAHYREWQYERLAALPGMTGLWQVEGRGRVDFNESVRMDIDYVRNRSLRRDADLLLRTLPAVWRGRGAR